MRRQRLRLTTARRPRLTMGWRALLSHRAMRAAYVVAGLSAALLFYAYWVFVTEAGGWRCAREGKCGVAVASPRVWLDTGPFVAVADSDTICQQTVWCTARVSPKQGSERPTPVLRVRDPVNGKVPEGCFAGCAMSGACSAFAGSCVAHTGADCALTEGCLLWGFCGVSNEGCRPVRDADCAGSRACRVLGRCRALGGACRSGDHLAGANGRDADHVVLDPQEPIARDLDRCRRSSSCSEDGRCDVNVAGDCVVGSDEDCKASAACKVRAACTKWSDNETAECAASCADASFCERGGRCLELAAGLCGEGDDGACKASDACRLDGRCALVDGRCQATGAICAAWDGCRFDGRCAVEGGECRLRQDSCAQTIPCAKLGACSPSEVFEGCGVASDADCAGSEVCTKYGWCRAAPVGDWPMTTSRWFCFGESAHTSQ